MQELETGYLVVGSGAAGMAFTDEILTHSNATVTIAAMNLQVLSRAPRS